MAGTGKTASLELEWKPFRKVRCGEGPIPNKRREPSGVAVSAVTKRRDCALCHTQVPTLNRATDAVHDAKQTKAA